MATKPCDEDLEAAVQWISLHRIPQHESGDSHEHEDAATTFSFYAWRTAIASDPLIAVEDRKQLVNLALSVAFLREKCRLAQSTAVAAITPPELALVWGMICTAMTCPSLRKPLCSVSRSAQGFLAVPICSLVENGNIDELFRLHVWLPDGQRGNQDFAIHSHQPFAHSWILAGEGNNHSYDVEHAVDSTSATHAEYALAWSDGKNLGKSYITNQAYSKVVNTGRLVRAIPTTSAVHARDMSYSIPAATFHRTDVSPAVFHATLFFFNSHRGFVQEARVLGPSDVESSIQLRDPAAMTAATLASMVDSVRSWEVFMTEGQRHAQRAQWEHALRSFDSALSLCQSVKDFPQTTVYRQLVLGKLGSTNRRFGRFEQARDILEIALAEDVPSLLRIELSGELGVVYRHMNHLANAKRAFEIQYGTAQQLGAERIMCRAVGNLGMVNYQLSQQNHDDSLLESAIKQLIERVQSARHLKQKIHAQNADSEVKSDLVQTATTWETIGLSRLSLCYAARGDVERSKRVALEALGNTSTSKDSTVIAMSRFFYGRALLLDGRREEALHQFNPPNACTPAVALCKEPSEEHLVYLRGLVESGADMDLTDEEGYTALDYAVFNGDIRMEELVLDGLRQGLAEDVENKVMQRQSEARLRKGYRELFQEKLRPVLLSRISRRNVQSLRHMYADALAADEEKRGIFDWLKFLRYSDFLRFGKLPRSSDGLAQRFVSEPGRSPQGDAADYMIFFSYRWINKSPGASSPDDVNHTQYRRMIRAVEHFLEMHPSIDRQSLGIWMVGQNYKIPLLNVFLTISVLQDFACVNQDEPMLGVSALPMIVAQCDSLISLVDDKYYSRAWCCVEVMIVQTLMKSYGLHQWYEHVPVHPNEGTQENDEKWILREGPLDLEINMAEKGLSFEEDRHKVLFLERQSKLLG